MAYAYKVNDDVLQIIEYRIDAMGSIEYVDFDELDLNKPEVYFKYKVICMVGLLNENLSDKNIHLQTDYYSIDVKQDENNYQISFTVFLNKMYIENKNITLHVTNEGGKPFYNNVQFYKDMLEEFKQYEHACMKMVDNGRLDLERDLEAMMG
jgi:hypothetical protein